MLLFGVSLLIVGISLFLIRRLSYFKSTGLKYSNSLEYVISITKCVLGKRSLNEHYEMITHPFRGQRYVGSFEVISPIIVLRHPSAIRLVCLEKFNSFVNHKAVLDEHLDPLFGKMIFCMTDQKWRDMRGDLTPAFSGSKLKCFYEVASQSCKEVIGVYQKLCFKKTDDNDRRMIELDTQDLTLHYTTSFLAKSVFNDMSAEKIDEILQNTRKCVAFTGVGLLKFALLRFLPKFLRIPSIQITPPAMVEYFQNLLKNTMQWRSRSNIYIPDFVQMMGETKRDWTTSEKTAQLLQQSLTYVSTIPTQTSNTLHELAANPDILEKLQQEVDQTNAELNGELTYEALNSMEYLDMVISESLRKWPVASLTDRVCTKDCDLGPISYDGDKNYVVKEGQVIFILISAIQNDPEFWTNPRKFDPERFSNENKRFIKPLTYIPFGVGQRNCIAMKQVILHIKLVVYHILLNFDIKPGNKMSHELKYAAHTVVTSIEGGTWLDLELRNSFI